MSEPFNVGDMLLYDVSMVTAVGMVVEKDKWKVIIAWSSDDAAWSPTTPPTPYNLSANGDWLLECKKKWTAAQKAYIK